MLQLSEVSKRYAGGIRALSGINLEIPRGMFGLLGPNGAGKSTLDAHDRDVAGAGLRRHHRSTASTCCERRRRLRKVLGYLPQEFGSYPRVSA